jgi:hypothetical protein
MLTRNLVQRYARSSTASSVSSAMVRLGKTLCAVTNSYPDDVPMARVKFNANTEYAYLQNFKILQSTSLAPMMGPRCSAH